jgi:hypothetical protein
MFVKILVRYLKKRERFEDPGTHGTKLDLRKQYEEASTDYGCAVAQRLDAGFPPRRPGFAYGQHVGVCGGQSGTGAGFLRVLRFPLPIIPPISPLS